MVQSLQPVDSKRFATFFLVMGLLIFCSFLWHEFKLRIAYGELARWPLFSNKEMGYSVRFPPHWNLDAKDAEAVVISSSDLHAEDVTDHFDALVKIEILRIDRDNFEQVQLMKMGKMEPWTAFSGLRGIRLSSHLLAPSITAFYPVGNYCYLVAAYHSVMLPPSFFQTIESIQRSFSVSRMRGGV